MQSLWWCKAAICVTYTPYGCNDIEQDLLTPKQIQLQLFVEGAGTVVVETNPDFYMLQSNLKKKAKHSSGTKSGQYKWVQIRKMVICRVEKIVEGCKNKGSFQSKSIWTEGKTPTSRNWKKIYLHRKGNIQRKENHEHRCHSWNYICEWLPPESGGRTGKLIRKLQEVLKGIESFHHPFFIFWILNWWG